MNVRPLVRVVIPVYNRAFVIRDALESVRAQTFSDLEVIVVDDGSSDETAAIVAACAKEDPRIRLLQVAHGGASSARNAGVELPGSHEYVAFLDSDDIWLPLHLERAVAVLGTYSEISVYFSRVEVEDLAGMWSAQRMQEHRSRIAKPLKFATRTLEPQVQMLDAAACRRAILLSELSPQTPSVVVRRRAVRREPWFRPELQVLQDTELFLALAASGCHYAFNDQAHVRVRRFGDNLSGLSAMLSPHAVWRLNSVLDYHKSKLCLCSSREERVFVAQEIAETAYLLGQNYAERLDLVAARQAYRDSLRYRVSYKAGKGLVAAMLPASMYSVLRAAFRSR